MHLLQNALIADVAPLLVMLGLTPGMRAWLARRGLGRMRSRWILPIWLVAWYLRTSRRSTTGRCAPAGGSTSSTRSSSPADCSSGGRSSAAGSRRRPALAYLAAGFVGSSFLGLAYIFSSRPFYSFYEHAPRLWGLSATRDQNLGGILMNGEQTIVFLLAIGYFVMRLLEEEHVSGAGESPAAR